MRGTGMKKIDVFEENISTLKEISYDKEHKKYVVNNNRLVIDFDSVKTKHCNQLGTTEEILKSADGLLFNKNRAVFIEFKNGKINSKEKMKIKTKIKDSLLLFCDITGNFISYGRNNAEFILVYNVEANPEIKENDKTDMLNQESIHYIADTLSKKGKEEFIRFGFQTYKKAYFKDIHTYTPDEFEQYLFKYKKQLSVEM